VDQELTDHRAQVTGRSPKTGRLITLWEVLIEEETRCNDRNGFGG
jgi:hypothetical protein